MGKKILITGSSRGIGAATAERFAKEDWQLYLCCANSIDKLEKLSQYIKAKYNNTCEIFQCDVSNPIQVEAMFSQIPPLDVLVNNAGISYIGILQDMSYEEWNNVISTNLSSVFYCCKEAIPPMIARQSGKIINISSVWGSHGASCEVAYSASKGGMNSFTKALARELAPSNIQVNALACGVVDTKMNSCFSDEERNALQAEIPAGTFASPSLVADAIYQLAQSNPYLTGQIISLDGGWL